MGGLVPQATTTAPKSSTVWSLAMVISVQVAHQPHLRHVVTTRSRAARAVTAPTSTTRPAKPKASQVAASNAPSASSTPLAAQDHQVSRTSGRPVQVVLVALGWYVSTLAQVWVRTALRIVVAASPVLLAHLRPLVASSSKAAAMSVAGRPLLAHHQSVETASSTQVKSVTRAPLAPHAKGWAMVAEASSATASASTTRAAVQAPAPAPYPPKAAQRATVARSSSSCPVTAQGTAPDTTPNGAGPSAAQSPTSNLPQPPSPVSSPTQSHSASVT